MALVVFLLAWAGFFPGAFTVDSTQQWEQISAGVYQDWHPVFHTWLMGLLRSIWDTPGVVSLTQSVAFAAVLGRLSRALAVAGVPRPATIGFPLVMAFAPNAWTLTIAVWKDVPFGICVLWVFAEVVVLGEDPERFRRFGPLRFGLALLGVFTFRHNGLLVAGMVLLGALWVLRRSPRSMAIVSLVSVGGMLLIQGPLYRSLDSWPTPGLFTYTTFVHDMGGFLTEHSSEMDPADLALLATILPVERWSAATADNPDGLYMCRQATALIFPPELFPSERVDRTGELRPVGEFPPVVRQNPTSNTLDLRGSEFMGIWADAALRWPGTLIGHRLCVSGVAWSPVPVNGGVPWTVPLRISPNSAGIESDPLVPALTAPLTSVAGWWAQGSMFTYRPALWVYAGFLAVFVGARRRGGLATRWLWALPGFASWISVVLFTPGQSYRYVWPAHLCALASLALAIRPVTGRAHGRSEPGRRRR
ncbi:MAG: hypothetical protein ACFCVC_21195 [Acidimicrobiia bacterium]